MQNQVEMHHRLVTNDATMEPPETFWAGSRRLGYAAGHAAQLAYMPTGSSLAHPAKSSQKAFPIRVSKPGPATAHRPVMPGSILSSGDEQSEYRLRRKTPSGTIDAGYDGSPAQLFPGQPPFKQVILPVDPWQALPNPASGPLIQSDLSSFNLQSIIPDSTIGARNAVPSARRPSFPTGLPSTDPTFHPGSGNDHEQHHGFARILESLGPPQTAYQSPQALHMPGFYPLLARSPQELIQHPLAESFIGDLAVSRESTDPFTPGDGLGTPFIQPHHHAIPRPFDGPTQSYNFQGQSRPTRHPMPAHSMFTGDPGAEQSFDMQGPSPHRFQQKVLAHAHHTYVELMAQRHLRKLHNAKPGSYAGGSLRTFIHPKLPRQFPSHPKWPLGTLGSQLYAHVPLASSAMPDIHTTGQSGPFNPSFPVDLPLHLSSTTHTPPFQGYNPQVVTPNLGHKGKSLASAARASLEMLCHLCEQNEWKWTDGMILGGCLCYGVEDYEGALEWFFKVLALDPRYRLF